MSAEPALSPVDIQPVANETLDRTLTGIVTGAPIVLLGLAIWKTWNAEVHWYDMVVLVCTHDASTRTAG